MSIGKIMIVDDQPQLLRVMRITLADHGYEVVASRSGEEALHQFRAELPDLLVVDLSIPGMTGFEVCREIRSSSEVPIIVLSVRNSEKAVVQALDAGADDYLTKPFRVEELMSRIRAAIQRVSPAWDPHLRVLNLGMVEIDFEAREVLTPEGKVHLTAKELGLLRILVSHAGQVLSCRKLLESVWGPDYGNEVEYLWTFINHLRKKVEANRSNPEFIKTEAKVGYRFVLPEHALRKS
jgi:two-component system, OmpR family, KDP operon response regulator KdpE